MRQSGERLARVAGVVTALALGLVAWTGVTVTWRYRPEAGGAEELPPSSLTWSQRLVDWHSLSLSVAVVALVFWCGLTVASHGWRSRHAAVALGSTIGAIVVLASSVVAWHRVRWDQLALWAVTVGSNVNGLWYAAFSGEVRFVFVDGSGELSQSEIAPWVVVYLVAPFVALAFFGVGWVTTRPQRPARRSVVTVDA